MRLRLVGISGVAPISAVLQVTADGIVLLVALCPPTWRRDRCHVAASTRKRPRGHVMGLALAEYDPDQGDLRRIATQMDFGAERHRANGRVPASAPHSVCPQRNDALGRWCCRSSATCRVCSCCQPAPEAAGPQTPASHQRRNLLPARSSICRTPPASRATALRVRQKPEYAVQSIAIGSWVDARHARDGIVSRGAKIAHFFVGHQSADHSRPRVYQEAGQDCPRVRSNEVP